MPGAGVGPPAILVDFEAASVGLTADAEPEELVAEAPGV